LINAARNTGGSIGISLASNVLAHREQFHQSRLVESVIPSSVKYQDTLHQVTSYFMGQGSAPTRRDASGGPGLATTLQASARRDPLINAAD
jgi:MFS transporter, DHA2 family, multidrug resistance protein